MNLTRTYAVVLRQLYLFRSSPVRVLPLVSWVTIDIVLWGYLARYLDSVTAATMGFVPALLGSMLLFDFFGRVMQGVVTVFFEDVWSRNFLNFFATPLTIAEYLSGIVLVGLLTSFVGLAVMLGLATAVFGLSFAVYGLLLVPFVLTLLLFGITLGIAGSAVVLKLGPASEWLIWPITSLLLPVAGVLYPLTVLPNWLRLIGQALPLSYVFEGMRTVLHGGTVSTVSLLWGGGLTVLYLGLSGWWFARVHAAAVRSGLLARYSAETVS